MTWSIGLVANNKEFMCQMDMERQGIESYIPQGTRWTKPKAKKRPVRARFFPFPGYIFVRNVRIHYLNLKRVRGFKKVIFEFVSDDTVSTVKDRQFKGGFDIDNRDRKPAEFYRGEMIRITMGPLIGATGIVEKDTKGNNWVFLSVYGMRVKIFIDFIEKL